MKLHKVKALAGKIPAKFWMHCEFLLIDGGKMSKSLGNVCLVQDLIEKGYSPLSYKLMCYTSHYRNKLNFTWEALAVAEKALHKIREGYQKHTVGGENPQSTSLTAPLVKEPSRQVEEYRVRFLEAINDDLNMPIAMSVVWEIIKSPKKSEELAKLLSEFDEVLGLDIDAIVEKDIPQEIQTLLDARKTAREEKNWALSDQIRDEIREKGYIVKDTAEGQKVEKI